MLRCKQGVFGFCILALVFGCRENTDAFSKGEPSLSLRAAGSCGINAAPTIPESEFVSGQYSATARITVSGSDANNPGDLLNPDARVVLEFVDEEQGLFAGFKSTGGLEPNSSPLAFSGRTAEDELFCLGEEEIWIRAVIKEYVVNRNGVEETIELASSSFPIRCLTPENYQEACVGAALPDLGVEPDMEMLMADMEVREREPTWSLQFVGSTDSNLEIGIRDSGGGRPDSITLRFRVIDINGTEESGRGLEGVNIDFELPEFKPANIEIEPMSAITDSDGVASVTLLAGGTPGVVSVIAKATLSTGESLTARSGTVVIRGGIPSHRGFYFLCDHPVIPAFTTILENGDYQVGFPTLDGTACSVQLADRVNGIVDQETQLFFLSEAGTIVQSARTDENGVAVTRHGVGLPQPFTAGTPSDGIVTLVAVTRGEEDFYDVDGDKIYDPAIDFMRPEMNLTEPYIDVNDNGQYDEHDRGDFFVEEFRDSNGDGFWNGDNGQWDSDTEIWQTTHVLWVGNIEEPPTDASVSVDCGFGCSKDFAISPACELSPADIYLGPGGSFSISMKAVDKNGNCVSGYGSGVYELELEGPFEEASRTLIDEIRYDCLDYSARNKPIAMHYKAMYPNGFQVIDVADPLSIDPNLGRVTISITHTEVGGTTGTFKKAFTICR